MKRNWGYVLPDSDEITQHKENEACTVLCCQKVLTIAETIGFPQPDKQANGKTDRCNFLPQGFLPIIEQGILILLLSEQIQSILNSVSFRD